MIERDEDELLRAIRHWAPGLNKPLPQWWEWAVVMAEYHRADCNWTTIGVSSGHCSCGLTRIIAKMIKETHGREG